jgi:hypothetical protein
MSRSLAGTAVAALLLLLAAPPLRAQGTTPVPPTDLAYRDIERLAELGALDSLILGQRPYSRREVGRIVRVARDRLDRADVGGRGDLASRGRQLDDDVAVQANAILQRLASRFSEEADEQAFDGPVFALFDGVAVAFTSTDAIPRPFHGQFAAPLQARLDPLDARRLGRAPVRGQNTALELSQRLEATSWLSFHARERLEYRAPRDTTFTKTQGELLLAAMRVRFRNTALTVGREQLAWGQAADEGLFLSSNAPALDQISLASDRPFIMPSVLRLLGPTQATLVLAQLGPSPVRAYSQLLAYKVSVQPHSSLELGATFLNHFGGEGGRPSSFGDRLIDFLPFVDIFRKHNYYDSTRTLEVDSDKLLGVDGRLRLAPLGGLLVTGEVLIDDFDVHRIPQLFGGYGSSIVGLTFPVLVKPEWSLKLTAKHMGILTYTHGVLTSGITTRERLLGEPLGPDAKEFGAEVRWMPVPSVRLGVGGWSAQLSDADYTSFYADAAQTQFVVRKTASRPNELRDRMLASLEVQSDEALALVIRGGAERIRNADFLGDRRKSYVVDVALRLRQ